MSDTHMNAAQLADALHDLYDSRDECAPVGVILAKGYKALERENADLRSDIERHVKIASDLATELEAARKDAERIDLIERTGCYPFKSGSVWTFIIAEQNSSKIQARGTGPTARAAIDAAIAQGKGEK